MKYWLLVLVPVMAFTLGCGKPSIMGTPIDKAKLEQMVPGTTKEEKVTEVFGQPFKTEMVEGGMTKYIYTYYEEYPRIFRKNKVNKQTLELYTRGGLVQKYDLKNEGVDNVTATDKK
jgi:outer membrane protein assembly factor BamE (lipoprotein component of BamABCDE complex)